MSAVRKSSMRPCRKDSDAVAVVVGTILMVTITILLVAALYVFVFGIGKPAASHAPFGEFYSTSMPDGYRFTFTPVTPETRWSDVYVLVMTQNESAMFGNVSSVGLESDSAPMSVRLGSQALGSLNVFMNITDIAANGRIDGGDSFTLTTGGGQFSSSTTYQVVLMHRPSASQICSFDFTGS